MNEEQIKAKLDTLADLQAAKQALQLEERALLDALIPSDVLEKMREIELEYSQKYTGVDANIANLTDEVKAAVVANGASVKGTYLHAVWTKGRVSWDGKQLDGMMALIPGLAAARSEGSPSVSIRNLK